MRSQGTKYPHSIIPRFTLEQQSLVIVSNEQLSVEEIAQFVRGGWKLSNNVNSVMEPLIITLNPQIHIMTIGCD